MKKEVLLDVQETLKLQLSEIRIKFEEIKKEKDCIRKQYRNATNEGESEKLEDLNKKIDKEYYELLNAIDRIPSILSSIGNIITGKYVNPYDF